jgi:hypothetical protein
MHQSDLPSLARSVLDQLAAGAKWLVGRGGVPVLTNYGTEVSAPEAFQIAALFELGAHLLQG